MSSPVSIFTKAFWLDAAERSIKTGAQFLSVGWGLGDVVFDIVTVDVRLAIGLFTSGMVSSIVTSVGSAPLSGSASLLSKD